ncbi:ABC transporter permease [Bacillus alveayuensis]|uniref:ABC transporter permease n=1 Tax=Aeribacillus alveayuensis TaxID=279215 RepID=UPI0005D0FDA0|nr:ABC transporter permease [Bacillus alveayuensis]
MIGPFIKKQFLLFIRNKQELLLLLGMPFILITILGFALGNIMNNNKPDIHAKVVFVEHGNEQEDFEKFVRDVKNIPMPVEQQEMLIKAAEKMLPITVLKHDVFGSEEIQPYIELVTVLPSDLNKIRKNESYTAIVEIPEHFSYLLLKNAMLGENVQPKLSIYVNEGKEITGKLVEDIIIAFQEQYSTFSALGKAGLLNDSFALPVVNIEGEMETVTKREPINSFTYYTVGMSVMFVLYIASYISSYAFREKQSHVFNRILLANVQKWSYIFGIFLTAMILGFFQLGILYGLAAVFYGVKWKNIMSFLAVTVSLCFAVGGLGAFLTALNYLMNSEKVSIFFSSTIVSIFAFLGGSFFPSGQISEFIRILGDFTPNGASMMAYLKILQGYEPSELVWPIGYLCIFGVVMFLFSLLAFPKRGRLS